MWLADETTHPWNALANALRQGLPAPNGFTANSRDDEKNIRHAYEELTRLERTHFAAVRSPSHALLDILGPDALIHSMRRLWSDSPDATLLVQRMVNSQWCGKAAIHGKTIRLQATEGMLMLDPDVYFVNADSGKCTRKILQQRQRKMFRWLDGTSRTVETGPGRTPLGTEWLQAISSLTKSAQGEVTWALDETRLWLLNVR